MSDHTRKALLGELLTLARPVPDIVRELRPYGWDAEEPLVALTRLTAVSVLARYLDAALSEAQVEEWANALEGRDDLGYEEPFEALLGELIHDLANPELQGELSGPVALRWQARIGG